MIGFTQPREALEIVSDHETMDPHFWLDPISVIQYVENIKAGLTALDPNGRIFMRATAKNTSSQLKDLDSWIKETVSTIPIQTERS